MGGPSLCLLGLWNWDRLLPSMELVPHNPQHGNYSKGSKMVGLLWNPKQTNSPQGVLFRFEKYYIYIYIFWDLYILHTVNPRLMSLGPASKWTVRHRNPRLPWPGRTAAPPKPGAA